MGSSGMCNPIDGLGLQLNPYQEATLGEMKSGCLMGAGHLTAVKIIEEPSSGPRLLAVQIGGRLIEVKNNRRTVIGT